MKKRSVLIFACLLSACSNSKSTSTSTSTTVETSSTTSSTQAPYNPTWKTVNMFDGFAAPFAQTVCDTLDKWKPPLETTKTEVQDFTKLVESLREMIGEPGEASFSESYIGILGAAEAALKYERENPNDENLPYSVATDLHRWDCDEYGFTYTNSRFGALPNGELRSEYGPTTTTTTTTTVASDLKYTINGYSLKPESNINGADLSNQNLSNLKLKMIDASSVKFERTNFSGAIIEAMWAPLANFSWANLSRTKIQDSKFSKTRFHLTNFSNSEIHGNSFRDSNLQWANFKFAKGNSNFFDNATLVGTDFSKSKLNFISFFSADLTGANFVGAELTDANFSKADLTDANFKGAKLTGAVFEGAIFERTIMPDGTTKNK